MEYKKLTMIKHLRKIKGWTQKELAEKSHITVLTIQRLEGGWCDPYQTKYSTLIAIAQTLGVKHVETLFEE